MRLDMHVTLAASSLCANSFSTTCAFHHFDPIDPRASRFGWHGSKLLFWRIACFSSGGVIVAKNERLAAAQHLCLDLLARTQSLAMPFVGVAAKRPGDSF